MFSTWRSPAPKTFKQNLTSKKELQKTDDDSSGGVTFSSVSDEILHERIVEIFLTSYQQDLPQKAGVY